MNDATQTLNGANNMTNTIIAKTETIEERVKRVSLAGIAGWSRAALHHAAHGERQLALACADHVNRAVFNFGDWSHIPVGTVYSQEAGRHMALRMVTRIGAKGGRYTVRIKADGTRTREVSTHFATNADRAALEALQADYAARQAARANA